MTEKEFKPTINPVENRGEVEARPRSFDAQPEPETTSVFEVSSTEITQELPSETTTPEPMESPIGSGFPLRAGSTASDALIAKASGEPINE